MNKELCGLVRCFQVASKTSPGKQQSRDLISETMEPRALRQFMYFDLSARKVLREEIVESKLNTQSMERSERNARDAVHVIASQERQGEKTR